MQKYNLNRNWQFYENNHGNMFFHMQGIEMKTVNLPHDFIYTKPRKKDAAGGSPNGYFDAGQGTYLKDLEIPAEWVGKRIILDIDGAYMNAEVLLNGELLGLHPYGYTPYLVDLSKNVKEGINKLKITTQSRQPSTRWYSGGGIYRSVALWVGEPIGVEPWDLFVTTPEVSAEKAIVNANITVSSMAEETVTVEITCKVKAPCGCIVAEGSTPLTVIGGGKAVTDVAMVVENPKLWDLDSPTMYTLETTVSARGQEDEKVETAFGIRKIEADAENGFRLNGKEIKLKGGCIHHDHAFLGAAAYPRAEERKIEILKNAGYNAVRISHYPPSLAMLETCDRQGILLLDEAFDAWRIGKVPMDYHLYFEDWWERDISYMVLRDRNHPCVITYSIGNEIGERDGSGNGAYWAKTLADKIRSLDNTRFVTSAICGIFDFGEEGSNFEANNASTLGKKRDTWGEKTAGYASALDIVGYNYLYERYESDAKKFPGRVIMGTETHSFNTYDYWKATMDNKHVIGDFIWVAYDNLGEAGVGRVVWDNSDEPKGFMGEYPWRSCFQGDMDLCGYRTGQSYYREIMWGGSNTPVMYTTHPKHYGEGFWGTGWHWYDVLDSWNYEEEWIGKPVKVDVYADADEAEFFLNGESVGKAVFEKLIASCDVPYQPGVVEAVVYKNGEEIGRASLKTVGAAAGVTAVADRPVIAGDGQDLSYVALTIVDAEGNRVPYETNLINIEVMGARLAGIGSGNPCTPEDYGTPYCKAYEGRAMAAIIADEPGTITVKVTSEGLAGCEITIVAE